MKLATTINYVRQGAAFTFTLAPSAPVYVRSRGGYRTRDGKPAGGLRHPYPVVYVSFVRDVLPGAPAQPVDETP